MSLFISPASLDWNNFQESNKTISSAARVPNGQPLELWLSPQNIQRLYYQEEVVPGTGETKRKYLTVFSSKNIVGRSRVTSRRDWQISRGLRLSLKTLLVNPWPGWVMIRWERVLQSTWAWSVRCRAAPVLLSGTDQSEHNWPIRTLHVKQLTNQSTVFYYNWPIRT